MGMTMAVDQALYRRATLSNGVTVITEPMDHVRTVALGVWIAAGSRYEDTPHNGISHFIEHILFKGTATRSALAIAEAVDAIGGQLNAFTDKEHTCYYLRVLRDHLAEGMAILTDMLLHPAMDAEAVEKERQVLAEEIKMYEDAPDDLVHDVFAETLWPEHPLGRPVSGSLASLGGLTREDLQAYMAERYRPDAVLVTAAGLLDHEQIVDLADQFLGGWAGRAAPAVHVPPRPQRATAYRSKEIEQVHLCLGVPGLAQAHPDRYVLAVLDSALGSGMSSRLFQEIREERGLAYSISSYQSAYADAGAFVVYAGTSPAATREVVRLILAGLVRARDGLTVDEVARAKESLKGNLMLALETPGSRMSKLARSEQYFGRQITLDEIIADVDAVEGEAVRHLADSLLVPDRLALAAIGPFDQQPALIAAIEEEVRARAGA
ncbi:MAG TPA: pitrilysin family protein [bacterium]|nr:pitrilysin family protein [bacterium]